MKYLGDVAVNTVVRGSFNTRQADGTPITLGGTPALSVYKDGSTTQSTAGVALTVDFDSLTGHHVFAITTSADAVFYSVGSDFRVVLTAGTVDGVSVVGTEVACFSINNRTNADIGANVLEILGDLTDGGRLDLLIDTINSNALLARQILGNKHTVSESPAGTFTISVRNDADNATVRTIVYTPATGARTAS